MTITITIERDEQEMEVECEFAYHAASRGARDSCCGVRGAGPALEPDEPAEMELLSTSPEIDLTDDELIAAQNAAVEQMQDDRDDALASRYDD